MDGASDPEEIRREASKRSFEDLVDRARRLEDVSPEETLQRGFEMIESVHSLKVDAS